MFDRMLQKESDRKREHCMRFPSEWSQRYSTEYVVLKTVDGHGPKSIYDQYTTDKMIKM